MNRLSWGIQIAAALLYTASGTAKVFLFDAVTHDVPSFGALPRGAWLALGVLELVCTVGLIAPPALRWNPRITAVAAGALALETLVFVWVHVQYGEIGSIVFSAGLGLAMAFLASRRWLNPPVSPRATSPSATG